MFTLVLMHQIAAANADTVKFLLWSTACHRKHASTVGVHDGQFLDDQNIWMYMMLCFLSLTQ